MIAEGAAVRHILVLVTFFFLAQPLAAGLWGSRGISHAFELDENHLYVADGRGVSAYDVADPRNVRRIDVELGDDESHDLALSGAGALVLATDGGLDWFTVGGDGTLTRAGRSTSLGAVNRVAANAGYVVAGGGKSIVFLAWAEGGLQHVRTVRAKSDVRDLLFVDGFVYAGFDGGGVTVYSTDTFEPVASISIEAPSFARAGETLWIAANQSGLQSYDISDPAAPAFIARVGKNEIRAEAVAVAGNRAYVMEKPDVVRVYDIADRAAPRLVQLVRDWTHVVAASPGRLYLSGTIIDGEGLPFATGIPVRVYDTSGASASMIGEFRDLAGALSGVFTDGTLAWVSDPPYFRIIDVSQTDSPRELSSILVPNIQDHVRVRNGLAVLYGRSDVNLIDVTDPYAPKYLGEFESRGHPPSAAALMRDTIVEANDHSGLHIIDYSDPSNPVQIAGRIMHYHDVAAGDDAIYTFHQYAWVILDLTDRTKVVERKIVDGVQYLHIDTVPPNTAYPEFLVLSDSDGLETWSLREDRFNPKRIAEAQFDRPGVFGTSATSAYIAKEGVLLRLDMSNPTRFVDTGLRVTSPLQISAAGEKVVVADRYALRVYGPDTAPPPPPPPPTPGRRRAAGH
jgi:hypothetical protein